MTDETRKTTIWIIIFDVKKLTTIANRQAIPNQKSKNPTVSISPIKKAPEAINQYCHIFAPPKNNLQFYYTIICVKNQ